MMNKKINYLVFVLLLITLIGGKSDVFAQGKMTTLTLTFMNIVKDTPVVLYDVNYTNPFGEKYTINKFRYYISKISFIQDSKIFGMNSSIYLIDEGKVDSKSISLKVPAGNYSSLNFQIGVDSIYNVSGAQTGSLDPTKDMFWTWNTGYVMAKLEGISPASKVVNGKYEFHIGGFSGKNNVLKTVNLPFPQNKPVLFAAGKTTEIIITADVDAWFQNPHDMKIADKPAINSPGKFAVAMSENYADMFTIEKILNHP
jgi:hypothetical protein